MLAGTTSALCQPLDTRDAGISARSCCNAIEQPVGLRCFVLQDFSAAYTATKAMRPQLTAQTRIG